MQSVCQSMLSVPILIRSYRVPHALIKLDSNPMNCTNCRENRPSSFLHTLLTAKKQLVLLSDIHSYKLSFLFSPIPRNKQDVLCFLCAGYSSYWSATTITALSTHLPVNFLADFDSVLGLLTFPKYQTWVFTTLETKTTLLHFSVRCSKVSKSNLYLKPLVSDH